MPKLSEVFNRGTFRRGADRDLEIPEVQVHTAGPAGSDPAFDIPWRYLAHASSGGATVTLVSGLVVFGGTVNFEADTDGEWTMDLPQGLRPGTTQTFPVRFFDATDNLNKTAFIDVSPGGQVQAFAPGHTFAEFDWFALSGVYPALL